MGLIQKPPLGRKLNWGDPINHGLVGYWLMNEGAGDKIYDLSGNGNVGTLGAGAAKPSWAAGPSGHILSFDGGDYVNCSPVKGWSSGSQFSFVVRVNVSSVASTSNILNAAATGAADEIIRISALSTGRFQIQNDYSILTDSTLTPLTTGLWYHLAVTVNYAAQVCRFYVNGVLKATDTSFTEAAASMSLLYIGLSVSATGPLPGMIDFVQMWNRALSASDVARLYREPFAGIARDPIAIWGALGGGTAYTETINDGLGVTDAESDVWQVLRTVADGIGLTDAISSALAATRTVADSASMADNLSQLVVASRAITDSIGLTDGLVLARVNQIADSMGITDEVASLSVFLRDLMASLGLSDSIVQISAVIRSVDETLGITDIESEHLGELIRAASVFFLLKKTR